MWSFFVTMLLVGVVYSILLIAKILIERSLEKPQSAIGGGDPDHQSPNSDVAEQEES